MFKRLANLLVPTVHAGGTSGVSRMRRIYPPAVEQRAAVLAGKHITYTLKRSSRRRSIGLRIDDNGLTVSMPLRSSEKWLDSVLQQKADWVVEKLDGWQSRRPQPICWADGEHIPYLGELVMLRVMPGKNAPATQHGEALHICGDASAERIERRVSAWYRQQAMSLFEARVAHYAALLNVAPREIRLSSAKTQWGSCTSRGTVRLNWQLIKLPQRLIDYVVVHELAHLHQMNHSAAFWAQVGSVCPDYLRLRRELKAIGLR